MTDIAPHATVPKGTFAEAAAIGTFKIGFYINGILEGYLGRNGNDWAVLVGDISEATNLQWYPHGNVNYIQNMDENNSYMSVGTSPANNGYVGFYGWSTMGDAAWTLQGTPPAQTLVSAVNDQAMSLYSKDNAYIYCWSGYTTLNVQLVNS